MRKVILTVTVALGFCTLWAVSDRRLKSPKEFYLLSWVWICLRIKTTNCAVLIEREGREAGGGGRRKDREAVKTQKFALLPSSLLFFSLLLPPFLRFCLLTHHSDTTIVNSSLANFSSFISPSSSLSTPLSPVHLPLQIPQTLLQHSVS